MPVLFPALPFDELQPSKASGNYSKANSGTTGTSAPHSAKVSIVYIYNGDSHAGYRVGTAVPHAPHHAIPLLIN